MQNLVSTLRINIVAVEAASKLYALLENLIFPRFANARLQLPCIAFPLTGGGLVKTGYKTCWSQWKTG
ncbi:hypothetical protein EV424DRAFT_1373343, partial [Suillus variegatus]